MCWVLSVFSPRIRVLMKTTKLRGCVSTAIAFLFIVQSGLATAEREDIATQDVQICEYCYGQWNCHDTFNWMFPDTNGCIGNNCDENDQCDSSIAFEGHGGAMDVNPMVNFDAVVEDLPNPYANHDGLVRIITLHFEVCFYSVVCNMECEQVLGEPHCTQVDWLPSIPVGGFSGTEGAICPRA